MKMYSYLNNMIENIKVPDGFDYVEVETINVNESEEKKDLKKFKLIEGEPSYIVMWFNNNNTYNDWIKIFSFEKTEKGFKRKQLIFVEKGTKDFDYWFDKIEKNRDLEEKIFLEECDNF
nr:MAG TPA: hypothetical protein [Caudoviricetes sp.]